MLTVSEKGEESVFRKLLKLLLRIDWLALIPTIILLVYGVMFIYGTGQQVGGYAAVTFWKKQLVWIALGFVVWLVLAFSNYRYVWIPGWILYAIGLLMLVMVLFWGVKVYGAKRWLDLPGFRVQPSEFAKLAVLITVAWFVSLKDIDINKIWNIGICAIIGGIPFFLILIEPDLGSASAMIPIVAVLLFVARLKWRIIIFFVASALIAVPAAYPFLHDYQKERIYVFLDPDRDPLNRGWNQLQSELAVGSGGTWGKGFMEGTQNTLGFLPQTVSNTDFIFSVIAEETGFVGSCTLLLMYTLIIAAALRTAIVTRDEFGKCLAAGIAAVIFFHSFVNIGMSIRIMPVTGIPLPLVSYGGSFTLTMMTYLGILQSIYACTIKEKQDSR